MSENITIMKEHLHCDNFGIVKSLNGLEVSVTIDFTSGDLRRLLEAVSQHIDTDDAKWQSALKGVMDKLSPYGTKNFVASLHTQLPSGLTYDLGKAKDTEVIELYTTQDSSLEKRLPSRLVTAFRKVGRPCNPADSTSSEVPKDE